MSRNGKGAPVLEWKSDCGVYGVLCRGQLCITSLGWLVTYLNLHSSLFTLGLGILVVTAGAPLDPSAWMSGLNKDLKWLSGLRSTVQWENHVETAGVYGCNYV